jgi:hypothetical protein
MLKHFGQMSFDQKLSQTNVIVRKVGQTNGQILYTNVKGTNVGSPTNLFTFGMFCPAGQFAGRHDTWHNDIRHKDIQHSDTQHNDTQHYDTQHSDTQHSDTQHNDTQHNDT